MTDLDIRAWSPHPDVCVTALWHSKTGHEERHLGFGTRVSRLQVPRRLLPSTSSPFPSGVVLAGSQRSSRCLWLSISYLTMET